jgi:hypothetical protein
LLNLVATNDRVVAFFPKGLQPLRIFDLGSAGHDGFRASVVTNSKYVVGEHNAGIGEEVWQDIARFIVTGQKPIRTRHRLRQTEIGRPVTWHDQTPTLLPSSWRAGSGSRDCLDCGRAIIRLT